MRRSLAIGVLVLLTLAAVVLTTPAAMLERLVAAERPIRLAGCEGWLLRSGNCQLFLRTHSGWMPAGVVAYDWNFDSDAGWGAGPDA